MVMGFSPQGVFGLVDELTAITVVYPGIAGDAEQGNPHVKRHSPGDGGEGGAPVGETAGVFP
jgi:hypothetical protein